MKRGKVLTLSVIAGTLMLCACASSIKKADFPVGANPSEEISKLETDLDAGHRQSLDLLAADDFTRSQQHLKSAKEELADGGEQKEVLEELAYSRAYLERAEQMGEVRRPQVKEVLMARTEALQAGVREFPPTRERLKELDDKMRDHADDFSALRAKEISDLQASYMTLQFDAMKNQQIGAARAKIQDAKDHRAARYAPKALRQAEMDLASAENMLNAHRSHPEGYESSVAQANLTAERLTAILAATKGGRVDETTATQLVAKDRRLEALQGRVGQLQGELGETSSEMGQMNRTLAVRERELAQAQASVQLQKSLQEARREFSPEEAEVFQEGDKLLIRLKAMNFPSGRSDLPARSIELLSKVKEVASHLGPQAITIEGHTDAIGTADVNEKLSQARAESVAKYLANNGIEAEKIEAQGHGFEKPIASNKSSTGRAQNRRVDILITPVKTTDGSSGPSSRE